MIFVAVGTQKFQLNRLLIEVDRLVLNNDLTENVYAQIGNSDYIPKNYPYKDFLKKEEFDGKVEECSLLITHAGVGTITTGLKKEKPIIVFPRISKYKEHVDNHQLEIAKPFFENGYILACLDEHSLCDVIIKSKSYHYKKYCSEGGRIIQVIKDYLKNL